MFIESAFKYLHDSWRYIVGFIVVFIVWQLGSIPLVVAAMFQYMADGGSVFEFQENPNLLMTVLDSNLTLFLMLLSFAIGLLALYIWVRLVHKQPFSSVGTSRKRMDWGRFAFGFLLIAVTTIATTVWDYYENPEDYVLQFQWGPFIILAVVAVSLIPLQTAFEEYLFRGYLMQGLGIMARNRWLPLLVTSVIFGSLHFFNPEVEKMGNLIMFYYIGTALFLGIMTLMDDGLELALGFHTGNNLVGALLVTADWTAFKTDSILKDVSDPTAGMDIFIPLVVIYPIFLGLMAWRYKWTDWNTKLMGPVYEPVPDAIEEIGSE